MFKWWISKTLEEQILEIKLYVCILKTAFEFLLFIDALLYTLIMTISPIIEDILNKNNGNIPTNQIFAFNLFISASKYFFIVLMILIVLFGIIISTYIILYKKNNKLLKQEPKINITINTKNYKSLFDPPI